MLSETAQRVLSALEGLTPFAETIVRRQAEHLGHTLETVPLEAHRALAQRVLLAAKVYLEPTAFARLEVALRA